MIEEDAKIAARKTNDFSRDVGRGCQDLAASIAYGTVVIAIIAIIGWILSLFT